MRLLNSHIFSGLCFDGPWAFVSQPGNHTNISQHLVTLTHFEGRRRRNFWALVVGLFCSTGAFLISSLTHRHAEDQASCEQLWKQTLETVNGQMQTGRSSSWGTAVYSQFPHTQYRMFLARLQGMNEETNLTLLLSLSLLHSLSICISVSPHTPPPSEINGWQRNGENRQHPYSSALFLSHQRYCVTRVFVCYWGVCVWWLIFVFV